MSLKYYSENHLVEVGTAQEPVRYTGTDNTNPNYSDGGFRVAVGVQNYQVLRTMGNDADNSDGFGWTYHHSPDFHYWNGKLYVICNSTPKDEDTDVGHCLLMTSNDSGVSWSRPTVIFPEQWVMANGVEQQTLNNLRLGFWESPYGRLYAMTGYYPSQTGGSSIDPISRGDDTFRRWFGVAVREINKDGTFGNIYFVADNPNLYELSSLPFPYYTASPDNVFRNDCELMRSNPLIHLNWWEYILPQNFTFPQSLVDYIAVKGDRTFAKGFCFFHRPDHAIVALWKYQYSALSYDEGKTWTQPVQLTTLGAELEKVWGQKTEDGKFAVSWKPPQTIPERYPLIVATGNDGKTFNGAMLAVNDEVYKHYEGLAKLSGPGNYQKGIPEGSCDIPGTDMWLIYSMSKEDIWISRIPVPIRGSVTEHVNDNFNNMETGGVVTNWNIYSPRYAPVRVVEFPSASDKTLELRDMDPFDFAKAERVFPESEAVTLSFKVMPRQTSGQLDIEVRSAVEGKAGYRPIRLSFNTSGFLHKVNSDQTTTNLMAYQADVWYSFVIDVDTNRAKYSVQVDGKKLVTDADFVGGTPVPSVERLSFRTGDWRPLHIHGEDLVDPELDHPVAATVFNIDDVVSCSGRSSTL